MISHGNLHFSGMFNCHVGLPNGTGYHQKNNLKKPGQILQDLLDSPAKDQGNSDAQQRQAEGSKWLITRVSKSP